MQFIDKMDPVGSENAVLAKASYDYYHHGKEKVQSELNSYKEGRGWKLDSDLSNKNGVVLHKGKNTVISYRGTDPLNPSDLFADTQILLFGREHIPIYLNDRFDEADSLYARTKAMFPNNDISLTGHSLGGSEALYVANKRGVPSVTFNTGSSIGSAIFSNLSNTKNAKNQTVYITAKDIISNLNLRTPYNVKIVPTRSQLNLVTHDISHLLPERQKEEYIEPEPMYMKPMFYPKYKPTKYIDGIDIYTLDYFKKLSKRKK